MQMITEGGSAEYEAMDVTVRPQGCDSGSTPVTTATPEAREAIAPLNTSIMCSGLEGSGITLL